MKSAHCLRLFFVTACTLSFTFAGAAADSPRERLSFNAGWKFARFGPQADGLHRPEPGAAGWLFSVTVSSEQPGNAAALAVDGDAETRWCASGAETEQWMAIDLGDTHPVARAEVQWEFPNLAYGFVVERSVDGKTWLPLPGAARQVRIRATALPAKKWASIREVKLFAADGREIQNHRVAAEASPAEAAFDDGQWRALNLPHDWGVEGPFVQDYPGETGKLPWWGIGWYRKHFSVPAADAGRQIFLDVDGAMSHAKVWLNGQAVGGWAYGYASWRVDLTPFIKPGAENVLAIRLDNPPDSSRWYPGGGIYRNVWLVKTAPVHIVKDGLFVSAKFQNTNNLPQGVAEIRIAAEVANTAATSAAARVKSEVFDPAGKPVGTTFRTNTVTPLSRQQFSSTLYLAPTGEDLGFLYAVGDDVVFHKPVLWSLENPKLYKLVTTVEVAGRIIDRVETRFGIRTVEFTINDGLHLNGRRVPIKGVCNHHDLGALGAAFNTRAAERQVEILKEMGCNAIRTSHNPPAPELLDLCDRLGMIVMDEAFDCWEINKTPNDYHRDFPTAHEKDIRAYVRRDRNHPCVVLWSIGNEIPEQSRPRGLELARQLSGIVHDEDPTRPTTFACSDTRGGYNGYQNGVDVFGYNYKPWEYKKFRTANPAIPIFGSETSSCISSRGEYFFPVSEDKSEGRADFQMSSYDLYAPGWATPPDAEFRGQDAAPFVAGEFVWTGFDYLGEPTPYNSDMSNLANFTDPAQRAALKQELEALGKIKVPSRSSYFGIVDLAGFKKDRFYLYQARWRPDFPMAHLLPHWNWPDRAGQATPVHVYTSGDAAELFLNGKSLGKKSKGQFEYRLRWNDVLYQPGELKVVAYKNGKPWATDTVKTTGQPAQLILSADRATINANGEDLAFITVRVADQAGLTVPRSKPTIKFTLAGAGEIAATDNGDATSFVPFQSPSRPAYNGLALAIVRSTKTPGNIRLTASAEGLKPATISIQSKP
jgi:beta-galactosidase